MKKAVFFTAAVVFLMLISFPASAEETSYTNESVSRLSYLDGKVFIQRPSDIGFEEGILNSPVSEGDRIGTAEGRAEIHFGLGNYLRLDENSKIDIMSLPKKGQDQVRFRIWSGNAYVVVGSLRKEKSIEIHTPDSSFYVLDRGIYRIDVGQNRNTELLVFQGIIEAAGEGASHLVKASQRLEIAEGRFQGKPARFMAVADDSFDRFNESRNLEVGQVSAKRYLPEEMGDFEQELARYGEWVYVEPYGYVWVPGDVGEDWRPYWNGYWVWLGLAGWTWVPYEPWGWATFHYGRWHWTANFGWYWIPTSLWGPAWVSWWWDMNYIGWSPMSWWGYPVAVVGGAFYGHYYGQYYPADSMSLTVIRKNQLKDPHISAVALNDISGQGLKSITMTNERLNLRPEGSRITIQNIEGSRVILRKDPSGSSLVPSQGKAAPSPKTLPGGKSPAIESDKNQAGTAGKQPESVKTPAAKQSKPPERKIRKKEPSETAGASFSRTPAAAGTNPSTGRNTATAVRSSRTIRTYPPSSAISRSAAARTGTGTSPARISSSSRRTGAASSPRVSPRSSSSSRMSAPSRSRTSSASSRSGGSSGSIKRKH